jgi:hypothetical protein
MLEKLYHGKSEIPAQNTGISFYDDL